MDDQLTEDERTAVLSATKQNSNKNKHYQGNRNVVLGVKFAVWHLLLFTLSVYLSGKIAGGWLTLFFMEVPWFPIDFPWSLLDFILMQKDISQWLDKIRALSSILDYIFYPPILVHGVIGTIWWGFLPTIYLRYKRKKAGT